MLKFKDILLIGIAALLTACSGDDIKAGGSLEGKDYDPVGTPVQFSVGLEGKATTRAVMADGGRFVCTMYYKASEGSDYNINAPGDGGTMQTAWLQIYGSGNAKYMNHSFTAEATSLFWQNRWSHVFLALADYNKLMDNIGATYAAGTQGMLKMYPNHDNQPTENTYNLTRGELTSMAGQPDPILAKTIKAPVGDPSVNVVELDFKHQFAQIQVNVKNKDGNSPAIEASRISKVELLGVSTEVYVTTRINNVGEVSAATCNNETNDFNMFVMDTPESGYLKSFNAIAFGHLTSIRVTWNDGTGVEVGTDHTPTHTVNITLESGKKYVYNLEISRIAVAGTRGDIGNRSKTSEEIEIKDIEITNWPVKFE